jgi:hypothetical protein
MSQKVRSQAPLPGALRAQALAALGPTTGENLTAILGGHAEAEAVTALTNEAARLIRTLHFCYPRRRAALLD